MTKALKGSISLGGIALVALVVAISSVTRTYYVPWSGMVMIAGLLVGFVFGILWMMHEFRKQSTIAQIIKTLILVVLVAAFPIIFAIVGFMGEGLCNDWCSR